MEELREREYQVTLILILILIFLLILILGKIIFPVLIIVSCPSRWWSRECQEVEGAEEEEESKEEQEA